MTEQLGNSDSSNSGGTAGCRHSSSVQCLVDELICRSPNLLERSELGSAILGSGLFASGGGMTSSPGSRIGSTGESFKYTDAKSELEKLREQKREELEEIDRICEALNQELIKYREKMVHKIQEGYLPIEQRLEQAITLQKDMTSMTSSGRVETVKKLNKLCKKKKIQVTIKRERKHRLKEVVPQVHVDVESRSLSPMLSISPEPEPLKSNPISVDSISIIPLDYKPQGILLISNQLFACDYADSKVDVFDITTNHKTLSFDCNGAYEIATDKNNVNLYIIDGKKEHIKVFDRATGTLKQEFSINGKGPTQVSDCYGIAVDIDHNIFVSDGWQGRVQKYNSNGDHILTIGEKGEGEGQLCYARGVAVCDKTRQLFVCDYWTGRMNVYNSEDGKFVRHISTRGTGQGQIKEPWSVKLDWKGRLVVGEGRGKGQARIHVFTKEGEWVGDLDGKKQVCQDKGISTVAGIEESEDQEVFVSDWDNKRILRMRYSFV
eukprot:TRINITY_DN317_c0_g1_i1.p1 TRINITY_DN317_c0_g1~~TRINITY_DN317_c0_g1_i1.p1  ORF type:complete len:510 (-),score=122.07 TRINITY_DN317_c0_g1_i1:17-1492(-)